MKLVTIRKIEKMGRIALPKPLREQLGWMPGTPIKMYVQNHSVIIKEALQEEDARQDTPYKHGICQLCNKRAADAKYHGSMPICNQCIDALVADIRATLLGEMT